MEKYGSKILGHFIFGGILFFVILGFILAGDSEKKVMRICVILMFSFFSFVLNLFIFYNGLEFDNDYFVVCNPLWYYKDIIYYKDIHKIDFVSNSNGGRMKLFFMNSKIKRYFY